MPVHDHQNTTLRALGKDEVWLRDWLVEKPSRLGLGNLMIKDVELQHNTKSGGRLDILAYRPDLDTYYEIELMLGEANADHGFRCLDYWARERLKNPNSKHIAVLAAENLSGRYKTVIETLPSFLPFIAIELRVLCLSDEKESATVVPFVFAQPDDLIVEAGDEPAKEETNSGKAAPRDRDWWEANSSTEYIATVDALVALCLDKIGPSSVDYTASSYISLKKGRRCWFPMWKRQNGAYVYIPGGSDGTENSPSEFFQKIRSGLLEIGLDEPSWTYKYNAGANPISFAIPLEIVKHSRILEILQKAYELA
jgi:hypothetical protein